MKTRGVVLFGLLNKLGLLQKRCHSREDGNPEYFNKGLDSGLKPAGMTNYFFRSIIIIAGILCLAVPAFAGTIELPQTGQTKCYSGVSPYNEIPCAGTGQDGEIMAGVA
ncbi:MAG: hypothetical protein HY806_01230 [Nitrospirae bacterium]|nr:hypothetical protein [Nitrospirota bacterium]